MPIQRKEMVVPTPTLFASASTLPNYLIESHRDVEQSHISVSQSGWVVFPREHTYGTHKNIYFCHCYQFFPLDKGSDDCGKAVDFF